MTGISYKATIDDKDMRAKLGELIDRMENRQGFFKNVGEHLMTALGERFDNEEAPMARNGRGFVPSLWPNARRPVISRPDPQGLRGIP